MPVPADIQIPYVEDSAGIVVDGVAGESAWGRAAGIPGFVAYEPVPDREPTGRTRVRLLSDRRFLYVFFDAVDPDPGGVRANLGRRDSRYADDYVGLCIDTEADAQRAWCFQANPLGVQTDGQRLAGSGFDDAWDGHWEVAARPTPDGYAVEMAIPWRELRHPRELRLVGMGFYRRIARVDESSSWPRRDPQVQGVLVQEALLGGPGALPAALGLELVPELTWLAASEELGAARWNVHGVAPGLTASWRPFPWSTLLGTLNPDFSQVESDSSQVDVNLRYPLYYDEKRPFFLGCQECFETGFDDLVYTRSMVAPRYGVRATAETGGWVGALLQVLDASPAPSVSEGGGWSDSDLAGHQALETVARARRNLGEDGYLGGVFSDRKVTGTDLWNRVAGVDGRFRAGDRLVGGGALLVSGTRWADGRRAWAPAAHAELGYEGKHLWLDGELQGIWPDFRAENGFVTLSDAFGGSAGGGWTFYPGLEALPRLRFFPLDASVAWNREGELRDASEDAGLFAYFGNGSFVGMLAGGGGELWGGEWLPDVFAVGVVGGTFTSWLRGHAYGSAGTGPWYDPDLPRRARSSTISGEITFQPLAAVELGLSGTLQGYSELDGGPLPGETVGRVRLQVFLTPSLWARAIADWSGSLETEGLLAWEPEPRRAIYLGGSASRDGDGSWQVFAKGVWALGV